MDITYAKINKSPTMRTIRNKLIALYTLNVTDVIFTQILLSIGVAYEANPFMRPLTENTLVITLVKVLVPGILLYAVYQRMMQGIKESTLRKSDVIITIMLCIYALINCLHVFTSVMAVILM